GPRAPAPPLQARQEIESRVAVARAASARVRPVQSPSDVPRTITGGRPILEVEIQCPERAAADEVIIERRIEAEVRGERIGELRADERLVHVEIVADVSAVAGT